MMSVIRVDAHRDRRTMTRTLVGSGLDFNGRREAFFFPVTLMKFISVLEHWWWCWCRSSRETLGELYWAGRNRSHHVLLFREYRSRNCVDGCGVVMMIVMVIIMFVGIVAIVGGHSGTANHGAQG